MAAPTTFQYGQAPAQVAEFGAPPDHSATSPPAVVVHVHGGFWHAQYDRAHARPYCAALRRAGFATLNLEYRRVGLPDSAWPAPVDDVVAGLGLVERLADDGLVDGSRVAVTGHSAGGHLCLLAAARTPVALRGVVTIAAVTDLVVADRQHLSDRGTAARDLLGVAPTTDPQVWVDASPISHVPLAMPAVLVHGSRDTQVPPSHSERFVAATLAAGGDARLDLVDGDDHFAVLDARSTTFARVRHHLTAILDHDVTTPPPEAPS